MGACTSTKERSNKEIITSHVKHNYLNNNNKDNNNVVNEINNKNTKDIDINTDFDNNNVVINNPDDLINNKSVNKEILLKDKHKTKSKEINKSCVINNGINSIANILDEKSNIDLNNAKNIKVNLQSYNKDNKIYFNKSNVNTFNVNKSTVSIKQNNSSSYIVNKTQKDNYTEKNNINKKYTENNINNNNNNLTKKSINKLIMNDINKSSINICENNNSINVSNIDEYNIYNNIINDNNYKNRNYLEKPIIFYSELNLNIDKGSCINASINYKNIIEKSLYLTKFSLISEILNLKQRDWNNELISIYEECVFFKNNNNNNKDFLSKLINISEEFNWICYSIAELYYSTYVLESNLTEDIKLEDYGLPKVSEIKNWTDGFEWKNLFIKLITYNDYFLNYKEEIKSMKALFFDYLKYLLELESNKNLNTNNIDNDDKIVFPLFNFLNASNLVIIITPIISKITNNNDNKTNHNNSFNNISDNFINLDFNEYNTRNSCNKTDNNNNSIDFNYMSQEQINKTIEIPYLISNKNINFVKNKEMFLEPIYSYKNNCMFNIIKNANKLIPDLLNINSQNNYMYIPSNNSKEIIFFNQNDIDYYNVAKSVILNNNSYTTNKLTSNYNKIFEELKNKFDKINIDNKKSINLFNTSFVSNYNNNNKHIYNSKILVNNKNNKAVEFSYNKKIKVNNIKRKNSINDSKKNNDNQNLPSHVSLSYIIDKLITCDNINNNNNNECLNSYNKNSMLKKDINYCDSILINKYYIKLFYNNPLNTFDYSHDVNDISKIINKNTRAEDYLLKFYSNLILYSNLNYKESYKNNNNVNNLCLINNNRSIEVIGNCLVSYKCIKNLKLSSVFIDKDYFKYKSKKININRLLQNFTFVINNASAFSIHYSTSIANLNKLFDRYGINHELKPFLLNAISNKQIADLIKIELLCKAIKELIYIKDDINFKLKLNNINNSNNNIINTLKEDYFDFIKEKTLFDNLRNKIYYIVYLILMKKDKKLSLNKSSSILNSKINNYYCKSTTENNSNLFKMLYSIDNFLFGEDKKLEFMFFTKVLELKVIEEELKLDRINISSNFNSLYLDCIVSANNNPFTFLSSIEEIFNISINKSKKFIASVNCDYFLNELNECDITSNSNSSIEVDCLFTTYDIGCMVYFTNNDDKNNNENINYSKPTIIKNSNNNNSNKLFENSNDFRNINKSTRHKKKNFIPDFPNKFISASFINNNLANNDKVSVKSSGNIVLKIKPKNITSVHNNVNNNNTVNSNIFASSIVNTKNSSKNLSIYGNRSILKKDKKNSTSSLNLINEENNKLCKNNEFCNNNISIKDSLICIFYYYFENSLTNVLHKMEYNNNNCLDNYNNSKYFNNYIDNCNNKSSFINSKTFQRFKNNKLIFDKIILYVKKTEFLLENIITCSDLNYYLLISLYLLMFIIQYFYNLDKIESKKYLKKINNLLKKLKVIKLEQLALYYLFQSFMTQKVSYVESEKYLYESSVLFNILNGDSRGKATQASFQLSLVNWKIAKHTNLIENSIVSEYFKESFHCNDYFSKQSYYCLNSLITDRDKLIEQYSPFEVNDKYNKKYCFYNLDYINIINNIKKDYNNYSNNKNKTSSILLKNNNNNKNYVFVTAKNATSKVANNIKNNKLSNEVINNLYNNTEESNLLDENVSMDYLNENIDNEIELSYFNFMPKIYNNKLLNLIKIKLKENNYLSIYEFIKSNLSLFKNININDTNNTGEVFPNMGNLFVFPSISNINTTSKAFNTIEFVIYSIINCIRFSFESNISTTKENFNKQIGISLNLDTTIENNYDNLNLNNSNNNSGIIGLHSNKSLSFYNKNTNNSKNNLNSLIKQSFTNSNININNNINNNDNNNDNNIIYSYNNNNILQKRDYKLFTNNKDSNDTNNNRFKISNKNTRIYSSLDSLNSDTNIKKKLKLSSNNPILYDILLNSYCYRTYLPEGVLITFGNNINNETGHSGYESLSLPRLLYKLKNEKIKYVSSGWEHNAVITSNFKVYCWGNNEYGQCGNSYNKKVLNPTLLNILECHKTINVSCGNEHTIALVTNNTLTDNKVYSWGKSEGGVLGYTGQKIEYFPKEITYLNKYKGVTNDISSEICKIKCGSIHNIIVIEDYKMSLGKDKSINKEYIKTKFYSWGCGEGGQLGLPEKYMSVNAKTGCISDPTEINLNINLNNIYPSIKPKVKKISCGEAHSLILTTAYRVFGWGFNLNGQLGLGFCTDSFEIGMGMFNSRVFNPRVIPIKEKIIDIEAGKTYSYFISSDYELLACGVNDLYQLGMEVNFEENTKHLFSRNECNNHSYNNKCFDIVDPTIVPSFINMKVLKVVSGESHSLAYVEQGNNLNSNKTIWSWGNNQFGQLGQGTNVNKLLPKPINTMMQFKNCKVDSMSCGAFHSLILISGKKFEYILKEDIIKSKFLMNNNRLNNISNITNIYEIEDEVKWNYN